MVTAPASSKFEGDFGISFQKLKEEVLLFRVSLKRLLNKIRTMNAVARAIIEKLSQVNWNPPNQRRFRGVLAQRTKPKSVPRKTGISPRTHANVATKHGQQKAHVLPSTQPTPSRDSEVSESIGLPAKDTLLISPVCSQILEKVDLNDTRRMTIVEEVGFPLCSAIILHNVTNPSILSYILSFIAIFGVTNTVSTRSDR